ncbi:MAG: DnaD domain protein, partial [Oscillospiraceae bacterium]|nr:DnaD domain protein [Oscillospiraceae bacterium]
LKEFYTYTAYIKRLFEMDSNPTKNQKEIIARWQSVGYSEELLLFAHDVTVESIAKKNFKYIDKILQSWSDANVTTLEEAQKVRDEFVRKYEKTKDKKKGKIKNTEDKFTDEELEGYLSLVNRLEED